MQFALINGVTLHHARLGTAGKPHMVFINSLGTDFRIWHGVIGRLAPHFDILAYDKRGHGLSGLGETPYSMQTHAADLIGLMEHAGIKSAILCGVSVGGMIAMRAFAMRPAIARAMVLCDTGHLIGTEDIWNQRIRAVGERGISAISGSIMERWFSPAYRTPENPAFLGYRAMLERQHPQGYIATSVALRDEDLTEVAASIDVPVMGLVGEHDGSTPPDLMKALCALIPGAFFHVIADAGHLPSIEQPEIVSRHILDFAREV